MLHPHGYVTVARPEGPVVEYDSITCAHCQRVVLVKPYTLSRLYLLPQLDGSMREAPGAGCLKCGRPVCLSCCEVGTCTPIEKTLAFLEQVRR